jgi:hypothetical protein
MLDRSPTVGASLRMFSAKMGTPRSTPVKIEVPREHSIQKLNAYIPPSDTSSIKSYTPISVRYKDVTAQSLYSVPPSLSAAPAQPELAPFKRMPSSLPNPEQRMGYINLNGCSPVQSVTASSAASNVPVYVQPIVHNFEPLKPINIHVPESSTNTIPVTVDEKVKVTVKEKIENTRLYSRKSRTTISGEKPEWDNLDEEEKEYYFNEYDVRFNILITANRKHRVRKPEKGTSLKAYVNAYEDNVRMISAQRNTSNGKAMLAFSYYLLEACMTKFFKLSIFRGFAKFQVDNMYQYEQAMIELGELYVDMQDENVSPVWMMVKSFIIQTMIFLIGGAIAKMMGKNKKSIIDGLSSLVPKDAEYGDDDVIRSDNDMSILQKMYGMFDIFGTGMGESTNTRSAPAAAPTPTLSAAAAFAKGDDPLKESAAPKKAPSKYKRSGDKPTESEPSTAESTVPFSKYRRSKPTNFSRSKSVIPPNKNTSIDFVEIDDANM